MAQRRARLGRPPASAPATTAVRPSGTSDGGGSRAPHARRAGVGVDAEVAARIAARRPGPPVRLVPPVLGKRDVAAMHAHRRAIAAARPDIVQVNLPVPVAEQYTVLAALTVPG